MGKVGLGGHSPYALPCFRFVPTISHQNNTMQHYSPFDKPILELQTADLQNLKEVTEGWYVEYKQEPPNAATIAKSLSAFANTYGGWLFLGVQEESKENAVAGSFPGIAREDVDPTLQRMRKSAADHLNPTPHFETHVLWGPNLELGLGEDRAVICAWVPQSTSAPHVHKSGQIYRRVADASEPRAENDRFVLDQLWRRGDDIKRQHKKWYDRDPEFSDLEKRKPYVRLMFIADPWMERNVWITADDDRVRAVLGATDGVNSIPFDTVYGTTNGFIGRQLNGNDPHNLSLTWRLRRNLMSDVIIPLPLYQPNRLEQLSTDLHSYKEVERFITVLGKYRTGKLRIVDLNYLFNILVGVAVTQERLCELAGWTAGYYVKVKLLNSWRTIPYVDVPEVIESFEKYGPSMCLDSAVSFPGGTGPTDYEEISRHTDLESDAIRRLVQAFLMFSPLAQAYGIPSRLPYDDNERVASYLIALQDAGRRAIERQWLRNERQRR